MLNIKQNLGSDYSPLYFLSALGSGGLAVTFFMYLMFLTPHQGTPIPVFESWTALLQQGDFTPWLTAFSSGKVDDFALALGSDNYIMQTMIVAALSGIIIFSMLHIRLLIWNVREYSKYRETFAYQQLRQSNAEVQLMAMPLTFAMSINVGFILGALFVPGLWRVVEYLFPFAIIAFGITGYYALKIFIEFMSRLLIQGSMDCARNNNLSQMLAIFAFSMVGVGFSASAAMSHNQLTSGLAMILAVMFLTVAIVLAVTKLVIGFRAMFEHGIDREAAVSLWIIIPIITLAGIAIYRISMGMHHNFGTHVDAISNLAMFTVFISIQLLFAVLGYVVMKKLGYFDNFINGRGKSVASYALICPGVAGFVMAFFFVHIGLIGSGMVDKYSIYHLMLLIPLLVLQFRTIKTLFKLNGKLLKREKPIMFNDDGSFIKA